VHEQLLTALLAALVTGVACALGPRLIARVPEPADDSQAAEAPTEESAPAGDPLVAELTREPAPAVAVKPLYSDLAARPHLAVLLSLVGTATGGVVGAEIGWQPVLAAWVFLGVVGVLLGYVDAQTRLLPTWIIAPSYGILIGLLGVAGLIEGDVDPLVRSALGWLAMGGFYFFMWFIYPKGLGYGDVRLSGLLGLALGYLGWPEVLVGMYAGFLLGGVGGGLLSLIKVFDRKRYPFGPFMLLGALVGLVWGDALGAWYLNR